MSLFRKYFPKCKCPKCKFEFSFMACSIPITYMGISLPAGFPCPKCNADLIMRDKAWVTKTKFKFIAIFLSVICIIYYINSSTNYLKDDSSELIISTFVVACILLLISLELRSKELIVAGYSR
jgi:hypothetical protein